MLRKWAGQRRRLRCVFAGAVVVGKNISVFLNCKNGKFLKFRLDTLTSLCYNEQYVIVFT